MELYSKILTSIAGVWISILCFKLVLFVYTYIRPSSILRYRHNHSNSSAPPWAIVTGATDGIGKAYAYELADRGFNVVLHGRNSLKLHNVRHALQNEYPHLSFRIIMADAAKSGPEALKHIDNIVEPLRDLHITVLVNNVGTGFKSSGETIEAFAQNTPRDIDSLININVRFPVQFTRAVLPLLLSHGGPALILTMGSMSDFGMPFMEIYSASKSFDLVFSRSLRRQLRAEGKDVEVLGIMTGPVTDVGWDKTPRSLFRPASREFARAALARVGCTQDVVAAWWTHGIIWAAIDLLPAWFFDRMIVSGVMKVRKSMTKAN
jgi:17beta-estradiol 17-dehydrogenase / very-long-chain 3-oxoacyl-CoA reductase